MRKAYLIPVFLFSFMFAACGASEARVLQLGHLDPGKSNNAYQILCETFQKHLRDVSGGKMDVEIFSDAQLGGERAMMEGMQIGTVDMAIITNMYYSSFVPEFMLFDLPYLFGDYDAARAALDNEAIMAPMRQRLYEKFGVKQLDYGDSGFRYVVNNVRPIRAVADFQGLKIRLPESPIYVETFKALGANPTTMAFSETFTAVQQKTVDGLEITASAISTAGYYEVCSYLSLTRHFYSPIALNISRALWEGMGEEERGWLTEAASRAKKEQRAKVQDIEKGLLDDMGKTIAINDIEDIEEFRKAASPAYNYVRGRIGADAVDAFLKTLGL